MNKPVFQAPKPDPKKDQMNLLEFRPGGKAVAKPENPVAAIRNNLINFEIRKTVVPPKSADNT